MSKAGEEAKESRLWQPVTVKWFAVLCGVALGYAILRYHVVQGVEWSHFPLFILNKAVSIAAVGRKTHQRQTGQEATMLCECGAKLQAIAYITDELVVRKILERLDLSPPEQPRPPPDARYIPIDDEGREIPALVAE